ncbi:AAA family ATPase [Butyrivibrio fibrisolvens]|uniref:AAA family ATPase n=1 Tax=Butyrivibrio fibrisolvens TaxID=831 RepID=UPI0020BE0281|nr:AAA family ATPase [Butyrivibrio fibrisolvens]
MEFTGKKPVVLIGGMNGRGKTTILEAVLLSLYGSNSFAYTESKYQSYGQYLKSYINKKDGTLSSFVEIIFLWIILMKKYIKFIVNGIQIPKGYMRKYGLRRMAKIVLF